MSQDVPESLSPPALTTGEVPMKKKSSCLLVAVVFVLLILLGTIFAYTWYNRPIKPVQLNQQEAELVEAKISSLDSDPSEPEYVPGSKEIVLTEREINGLLNRNTGLGDKLKLTLATNQIFARVETDLDKDLPVVGGRKLKAKARFIVDGEAGSPSLVLDDISVWGISVPNDWLGGLKGKDLLSEVIGRQGGIGGIEELRIERGQLLIRLKE